MRKKILTILLILFCVGLYSQNDTITDQQLDFRIIFKAKPELYTQSSDSPMGKINFYRYDLTTEDNFYRMSISEFTELKIKLSKKEATALFNGFKKGFLNSYVKQDKECQFTSEKRFKFKNEFEALELLGKVENQTDFKMTVILKGKVSYAILVIGQPENEDALFYQNSFEFITSEKH